MKLLLLINIYLCNSQRLPTSYDTATPTPISSFNQILLPTNTPKPSILSTITPIPTILSTNTPIPVSNTYNESLCTSASDLESLTTNCKLNSNMYNNYIQNQPVLLQNQTQIIFDKLSSLSPLEINNVIRQAGILTLSSLSQIPFQTETSTFNFYAKQMKPLDDHQITISKFNMHLPSLNQSNIAISVIAWTTNPYISNQTIDTNVVSISLSNLSGSVLDTTQLSNPIQLSWNINNSYISTYNITCGNSTTISCPNSNIIYECSQNLTISCSNPTYTASCLYWNTSLLNWDNYGCYPVFANSTYITCNCTHLTDFSARLNAVYESNVVIFGSITEVYSIAGLIKYLHFYIIFGSLGLFGFITFIIGHIIDIYDSKKYNMLLYNLSKPEEEINTTKNILYIIWNRILLQHSQLSAIMKFDPSLPRVFRLLFVFIGLFNSLFITSLMYNYTYGVSSVMSLLDSFLLSLVTSFLNYPSLILLSRFIKIAGLAEFQYRYPILIDELSKRHNFENELIMLTEDELDKIDFDKVEKKEFVEESIVYNISKSIYDYFSLLSLIKKTDTHQKGSLEKAYYYATKKNIIITHPNNYLPVHTKIGSFVFFISIGWFIWCLNYLLLFSANHSSSISDSILISFAFNELQTIFLIQPLSLIIMIFVNYLVTKVKAYIFKHKTNKIVIPSLYYFADPFIKSYSTSFSTQLAFDIFINIPAKISHTGSHVSSKIKALSYSSVECIVEYLENGDIKYKASKKEEKIKELYDKLSDNNNKETMIFYRYGIKSILVN